MCDCIQELADIEEKETLEKAVKKQKPHKQELKAAPVAN